MMMDFVMAACLESLTPNNDPKYWDLLVLCYSTKNVLCKAINSKWRALPEMQHPPPALILFPDRSSMIISLF